MVLQAARWSWPCTVRAGCGALGHANTMQCHSCFSLLLLHADRVALRCIRRFVSIVCFSNSCNLLVHDYIITSLRSWQPRATRDSQCLLSPLHIEKSIRDSRRAVNVSCANITGSETSVAMETLKARLISRINYDKLFMVVLYYKYKLKQPDFLDASFLTFFFTFSTSSNFYQYWQRGEWYFNNVCIQRLRLVTCITLKFSAKMIFTVFQGRACFPDE